ncbi:hypothetical protein TNCV_882921 [Trichonephila clavipes]|nr:hypothetical protein TNCV_882921 [Trichonephila clavipes]
MLEPDVTRRYTMERVNRSEWMKSKIQDEPEKEQESKAKEEGSKKSQELQHLISKGTQANITEGKEKK